ncbi:MAG: alanine--tRNA ligase, partial [Nevskiales bacterium]
NFWQMGDTGPCGPCSEIFYDHGEHIAGGPPGTPEEDGDRYVEIWNLVFMQYDRDADGTLNPLPKPSVDTGMGLERVAAVMQGVHNNYDIDLFQGLIAAAAQATGCKDKSANSLKVIADHIRACAFLIADGVLPSKEGRGYVLRRIMRRAIRHGHKLGQSDAFFHKLVAPLVKEMGEAFPELTNAQAHIERVISQEEESFAVTLDNGMRLLETEMANVADKTLPGDVVFKLYDTYGFPVDLTADVARENELDIDFAGFEACMELQRERARGASQFKAEEGGAQIDASTEFTGYEKLGHEATVVALLRDGESVDSLSAGESGSVVLDATPFYAESGGQVGDTGELLGEGGMRFVVQDTRKQANAHAHLGQLEAGTLNVGDPIGARIDAARRAEIIRNHSATHLLHAVLREVLGSHVSQKGSLVAPDRLRFDFSHYEPVTADQLAQIENIVNERVLANVNAEANVMGYDDAIAAGAMALFGEKYGDEVRVLRFGEFSTELCGGTHVLRTGDIGLFKIVSEGGIASGVRRIEAVTGLGALQWVRENESRLQTIADIVKATREDAGAKVEQLAERSRKLEKELAQIQGKLASSRGGDLAEQAEELNGIQVLAARVDGMDAKALRDTMDQLKNKLGSAVIVLGAANGDKVALVAGVTKDQTNTLKAGELVGYVAEQVGGRGGGRPDMAQAGGQQPENLDAALASVKPWIESKLQG